MTYGWNDKIVYRKKNGKARAMVLGVERCRKECRYACFFVLLWTWYLSFLVKWAEVSYAVYIECYL